MASYSFYKMVRVFGGKKYVLSEQFRTKKEAQDYAEKIRSERKRGYSGRLARVVKGSDPFWKYAVYVAWVKG